MAASQELVHDHLVRIVQRQWEEVNLISSRAITALTLFIGLVSIVTALGRASIVAHPTFSAYAFIPLVIGGILLYVVGRRWDIGYPLEPTWLLGNVWVPPALLLTFVIPMCARMYQTNRDYLFRSRVALDVGILSSAAGFIALIYLIVVLQ